MCPQPRPCTAPYARHTGVIQILTNQGKPGLTKWPALYGGRHVELGDAVAANTPLLTDPRTSAWSPISFKALYDRSRVDSFNTLMHNSPFRQGSAHYG